MGQIDNHKQQSGGGTWGSITGTLSNQSDLQTALDGKLSATSVDSTLLINSGILGINLANANNWTGVQSYVVGDYRVYMGDIGGGYSLSVNFGGINYAEFCSATYAANFTGIVNVNSDYYIGGSLIGVSHWNNDAGYITSAALSGYQPLDSDLTALANNSTNGLWARTGTGTGSARTITGTTNQVIVANGNGVSGNPTLSLPQDIATSSSPTFTRLYTGLGTLALPAYSFTGDTNTGIYSAGADILNLVTGGIDRMNISASGKVGINETASSTIQLALTIGTASHLGIRIKGAASQTGDLLQFQNSAGSIRSAFNKDGYLSVGESVLNTTSPATYAQSVYYSASTISDNSATMKVRTDIVNTSAMNTYQWASLWANIVKTSASTAYSEAIYAIGGQIETQAGAGTTNQMKALYFVAQYDSNVTDSRMVDIYSSIASTRTVSTHYNYYIRNMVGSGTCNTQYGIYIEDMTKGTTNYAIYSNGGNSYHAGYLGIAVNGGAGKLSVLSTTQQLALYYDGSNNLAVTVSSAGVATFTSTGSAPGITFGSKVVNNSTVRLKGYTVATLPTGTQGDTAFVTDALAPTFLTTVVGGGAIVTCVLYNGTNWVAQ